MERRLSERMRGDQRPVDPGGSVVPFPVAPIVAQVTVAQVTVAQVTFDRTELRAIFDLYGRRVAEGEWRDYAIDFRRDKAVFSIYRRSSEMALYRVEKDPRLARRQGTYAVIAATGLVMKRGHDLARVLAVLDKPLRAV